MMLSCDTYFYQQACVSVSIAWPTTRGVRVRAADWHRARRAQGALPGHRLVQPELRPREVEQGCRPEPVDRTGRGARDSAPARRADGGDRDWTGAVPHVMQGLGGRPLAAPAARPLDLPLDVRRRVVEALEQVVGAERGPASGPACPASGWREDRNSAESARRGPCLVRCLCSRRGAGDRRRRRHRECRPRREFAAPVAGAILRAYFGRAGGELAQVGAAGGATAD